MSDYARVESLDALRRFRTALCKFAENVGVGLDEAEAEVQRTEEWLKQEQPAYWKQQAAIRAELYARAKSELSRKKMQKTPLGTTPSCVDELKALARAERQLEDARLKQAAVKRWSREFEKEGYAYTAAALGLRVAIQSGMPTALAQLDAMIEALEAYAASPQPAQQTSVASTAPQTPESGIAAGEMARAANAEARSAAGYVQLRTLTPGMDIRDSTLVTQQAPDWAAGIREFEPPGAILDGLALVRLPVVGEHKLMLARDVWQCERVVCERIATTSQDDSGWYIGPAEPLPSTPVECVGVRVGDLLASRPALGCVLELGIGYLIVFCGTRLEAVLTPMNELAWCEPQPASGTQRGHP